jgi:hypothetical protein
VEFLALAARPELADFNLVIPSLPGYGWSEAPKRSGVDTVAAAQLFVHLMTESLGYTRWVIGPRLPWGDTQGCCCRMAPASLVVCESVCGGTPNLAAASASASQAPVLAAFFVVGWRASLPHQTPGPQQAHPCLVHGRFFVQGGDWGGIIATTIGQIDATRCLGLHLNFFPLVPTPWMALVGRHFLSPEDNDKAGYPPQKLLGTIMVSGYPAKGMVWAGVEYGEQYTHRHDAGSLTAPRLHSLRLCAVAEAENCSPTSSPSPRPCLVCVDCRASAATCTSRQPSPTRWVWP